MDRGLRTEVGLDPSTQSMSIRVVLADDHRIFLDGLTRMLTESGVEVVASTGERDDLPAIIGRLRPDVAIVDISMLLRTGTSAPSAQLTYRKPLVLQRGKR